MFNKFYVFVPSALEADPTDETLQCQQETDRERMVREAQESGMSEQNEVEMRQCA